MVYTFNKELIKHLNEVLGVTQRRLIESYNGDAASFIYRTNKGTFPLNDLVELCNYWHIPISWFIVPEGMEMKARDIMPAREELVCRRWNRIESKWRYFGLSYSCYLGTNHKKSAEACGIAMSNYYNLFLNKEQRWRHTFVKDFLKIVNNSHVYPGCLLEDMNRRIIPIDGYYNISIREKEIDIIENHYMRKGIANSNEADKEMAELRAKIERLQNKLKAAEEELGFGYSGRVAEKDD